MWGWNGMCLSSDGPVGQSGLRPIFVLSSSDPLHCNADPIADGLACHRSGYFEAEVRWALSVGCAPLALSKPACCRIKCRCLQSPTTRTDRRAKY